MARSPVLARWPRLADVLCGLAIGLGQAPLGLWPLALLGLAGLLARLDRSSGWRAGAWTAWRAGAAYFALTLHWIVEPFLVDVARHGWMAPFALVLMAGGLALFWAAAGALAGGLRPGLPRGLGFALALMSAEMLRSYVFTGFPWALIGTIWIDTHAAQTAAFWGLHGLGLATLCILVLARAQPLGRGLATGAAGLALLTGLGMLRPDPPAIPPDAPVLRLVQPNAAQHLKWDPGMIPIFYARLLDLTARPAPGAPPALVIWPETAIAYRLENAGPLLSQIAETAGDAPVVLGAVRGTPAGATNALAVLDATGIPAQIYDKAHLVPFGEYVPFGDLAARLGIRGLAVAEGGGFLAGPGPQVLDFGPLGRALPLICYEAIFPNFGRARLAEADWMLQITNDAWFGQFAGPQQHLVLARFRAIERGMPLVRAANTGISTVIDPTGALTGALPLGVAGTLDAALPPALATPPYARLGDLPLLIAMIVSLLGLMTRSRARAH
ncbi:apolipoprotein N-acyltransferase [Dinoroseobacter shibae DFL 12 = DSM 16493]|uniref:Apolipoprotein N-acyltransferase n=1 Tax=Dinoroseobacter shibae (strain DSM 16493 / NCIMB 14021 / DFL 12) TaxID=398580 RepID=A8LSE1_DINSH|nr:apolipoprotein N-acyltransferase [Dinoroseobacter shibae]ABV92755.1 apolipoprotein N-acyltransferase [Dinoroseobacter shibae DFL 12 = DSM 16493]URF47698.1 apolipoprotein N-acyltransferase [Dinoroseobacter shibae]URF52008.1 apolipoprotein N-acyltransferase [Dinoroseobacter shibae]